MVTCQVLPPILNPSCNKEIGVWVYWVISSLLGISKIKPQITIAKVAHIRRTLTDMLYVFAAVKGSDEEFIAFKMSKYFLIIIKSFEITFLPVVCFCLKQKENEYEENSGDNSSRPTSFVSSSVG